MDDEMKVYEVSALERAFLNQTSGKFILTLRMSGGDPLSLELSSGTLADLARKATQMVSAAPPSIEDAVYAVSVSGTSAAPTVDDSSVVVALQGPNGLLHQFELSLEACKGLRVQMRRAEDFQRQLINKRKN